MSEEIKEILDRTLEYLEGIDETRNTKILTTNETNILLDYITNLQQKVEQLEKELKEANDSISWWSNRFKAVKRDNKQLENIIKEAINKLKEHRYDLDYMPWVIYKIKGSILFELTETLNKGSYKDVKD